MQPWIHFAFLVLAVAAVVAREGAAAAGTSDDVKSRAEFARLESRRVFFGHQSVGMNVLDGLKILAVEAGARPRITEVSAGAAIPPGTIAHEFIGRNGDPASKIEAFAHSIDAQQGKGVDIALVKYCYVDFAPDTDVPALAARYQAVIAELQRKHPRTVFVHVTAPISTVQGGAKGLMKRAMGKAPYGLIENVRREEYNALLRQAYQGKEPIFDLARVESAAPDGRVETVEWKGKTVPALVPAYTDDGGHLNREGQVRAARELLSVLAAIPSADQPAAK